MFQTPSRFDQQKMLHFPSTRSLDLWIWLKCAKPGGPEIVGDKWSCRKVNYASLSTEVLYRRRSVVSLDVTPVKSDVEGETSSHWCGVEVWRKDAVLGVIFVILPRFKISRAVLK
ncbi:hypothetical protein AVEN_21800-1 [Araneus ventricosus]|uniref:Uncharacterized protein n=1 Tax=Araneus ventricosus TaxID=182803 RepID=A0A4Y2IQY6_ARAVE|nr:hypothetical protein AVEN_21800-1 [Araneus ventricosus]